MNKTFYERLSYSIGNEDWKTEHAALKIKPTDVVFTVTASGDRPLNLLTSECQKMISVDANPCQNALCDLKMVALTELDYSDYLAFLGVTSSKERRDIFHSFEHKLAPSSQKFWKRHKRKIDKGILYQGTVEKLLKLTSFFIRGIQKNNVQALFSINNLEEQKIFIEKKWNEKIWKKALYCVLNPIFVRYFLKDPGLYAHVDKKYNMPHYLHDRLLDGLKKFPIRENILVSLLCYGKVFEEGFSPYLTKNGISMIQKQSNKLILSTDNAIDYLESVKEETFDCFSFSDIASYMKQVDFHRLCYAFFRAAKPGARFCIRQLLTAYSLPEELTPYIQRDEELESSLEQEDRCCIYRFLTGRVIK